MVLMIDVFVVDQSEQNTPSQPRQACTFHASFEGAISKSNERNWYM